METEIEKIIEVDSTEKSVTPMKLYNPNGMDFKQDHRMKSIEVTDEYTRIDFLHGIRETPERTVDAGIEGIIHEKAGRRAD